MEEEITPLYYTDELRNAYSGFSVAGGSLKGKYAIVTGGGDGIGKATARRLLVEGCSVTIVGRTKEKLETVVAEFNEYVNPSCKLDYVVYDIRNYENINYYFDRFLEGKVVDILVNSAGVISDADRNRAFRSVQEDELKEEIDINYFGTVHLTEYFLNYMGKDSKIIHVSSVCGTSAAKTYQHTPYGISKRMLIEYARQSKKRLKSKGIVVHCIAPSPIATAMMIRNGNSEEFELNRPGILKRCGIPEEVAAQIVFLCSDMGNYINNDFIYISSGQPL